MGCQRLVHPASPGLRITDGVIAVKKLSFEGEIVRADLG